jgi:predicted ArsR family transcriptional regulator
MTSQKSMRGRFTDQITRLEQQHLQETAELLDAMEARFGPEVADIVDQVVAERTRRTWEQIARNQSSNSLEEMLGLIWSPETLAGGYTVSFESRADGVMAWVHHCPVAKMARKMGVTKWANHLICKGDPSIVEGFNPQLGFRFIQSMMEGSACCQQFYFKKESEDGQGK